MAKRFKRAFTIVELVIVIAVIAILAAVLIPTFTTLIDKANQSNDTVTVKNLNTAIASAQATEEINTMQDALDAAQEYGYTVDKLTPSSSGDIVWDQVSKRFALVDKDGDVVYSDGTLSSGASLWKIVDKLEGEQDCSWYVGKLDEATIEAYTFTMGVDTGSVAADVKYERTGTAQNVTIRTAGGALTVNAANDTIYHYGKGSQVEIIACDSQSYHMFAQITGNINFKAGHFVAESGASAAALVVTASTATDVKVDILDNSNLNSIAATNQSVAENFSTIIQSGAQNIEIVETPINETTNSSFAGGLGTQKSPYLIETDTHLANISILANSMLAGQNYYFKQTADIITEKSAANYFRGSYDGNGYSISVPKMQDSKVIPLFLYPVGDVIISNSTLYSSSNVGFTFVYNAAATRVLSFENCCTEVTGGEVLKINVGNFGFFVWYSVMDNRSIEAGIYPDDNGSLVNVAADLEGQQVISFTDCVNNGTVQNVGTCTAAFIGQSIYPTTRLEMKNSANNGDIIGTSQAGLITGNSSAIGSFFDMYEISDYMLENVFNNGYITADNANIFSEGTRDFSSNFADKIGGDGKIELSKDNAISGKEFKVFIDDYNFYIDEGESTAYSYQLVFKVGTIKFQGEGVSNGRNLLIDLAKTSEQIGTGLQFGETVHAFNVSKAVAQNILTQEEAKGLSFNYMVEQWKVALVYKNENLYIIFSDEYIVDSAVSAYIYAYTNEGALIGTKIL